MAELNPTKLPSKARCFFAPDAVSEKLRVVSIKGMGIELIPSQSKGSAGITQGAVSYTESGAAGVKVDNKCQISLTPTSVESMEAMMKWIMQYQKPSYTGGSTEAANGTTGVLTLCNRLGQPVLEYHLTEMIPISITSPTYKAGDTKDLKYDCEMAYKDCEVKPV